MQSVEVPSRIDAENAVEVLAQLSQALAAGDLSGDSAGVSGDGRETSGAAARSGPLALDLAPLKAFDSSALSLLLQLARSRRGEDGADGGGRNGNGRGNGNGNGNGNGRGDMTPQPLFLRNPPAKLQELAELYGVAQMLFGSPDKGVGADASE